MRGLAVEGDGVAFNTESSEDGTEGQIEIEKNRALLDVELEIRGGVFQFFSALLHFFEIDSVFGERGGKGDALFVFQRARFIHVEMTGAGGRAEQAFAETRAFFIGPIDQANSDRWRAFAGDAAHDFQSGEDI